MLNFNQFNKKKEKYEVVKSISGLPMFVLPIPDSVNLTDEEPVQTKKKKVPEIVRKEYVILSQTNSLTIKERNKINEKKYKDVVPVSMSTMCSFQISVKDIDVVEKISKKRQVSQSEILRESVLNYIRNWR